MTSRSITATRCGLVTTSAQAAQFSPSRQISSNADSPNDKRRARRDAAFACLFEISALLVGSDLERLVRLAGWRIVHRRRRGAIHLAEDRFAAVGEVRLLGDHARGDAI